MINPIKFTNFKLSNKELEEYILFCIAVAGKNAITTAKMLDKLIDSKYPFQSILNYQSESNLKIHMKNIGFGCYNLKARGFWAIANSDINLRTCTVDDLEKIPGIGMKTSRFFVMHTREKDCNIACLDTHILKFMKDQGYNDIPNQTPSRKKYLDIQERYLKICKERSVHPVHLDLIIWNEYRKK